jgi:hypothetical protein
MAAGGLEVRGLPTAQHDRKLHLGTSVNLSLPHFRSPVTAEHRIPMNIRVV